MNRAAWLLSVLALCTAGAAAQQPVPVIHDDLSGTIDGQFVTKVATRHDGATGRLTFDIDYEYKASLLMGEPVVVCSAQIRNPTGSISFEHQGSVHTVEINEENATLLTPYNVDFVVTYEAKAAPRIYHVARCNTGIPGSWANKALNVPASPDWDDFLCWTWPGNVPARPDPMPDTLGDNWCKTVGNSESRILDEAETRNYFTGGAMRAVSVHVASFAVNYNDIVLAETKKLSAQKIAERKLEQVENIRDSLPSFAQGPAKQAAELLDEARSQTKAMSDPREQARTLQQALRAVFAIEEEPGQESAEFQKLKDTIVNMLSEGGEREFMAAMKQVLTDAQVARDTETQAVGTLLESQRQAAVNAPAFAFAGPDLLAGDTGPEDIEHEISRIDGHDGWPIQRVVFHPDGRRLLSDGADKTVRFWDIASGTEIWRETGYASQAIAISPDGRWAVIADDSGGVNVLDIETGARNRRFTDHKYSVYSLAISPDGRYLYSGSATQSFVTDFENGAVIKQIGYQASQQHYGTFNADSSTIISAEQNSYLIWSNLNDGRGHVVHAEKINQIELDRYKGREVQFASEDNDIITLQYNRAIYFRRHKDNESKNGVPGYGDRVSISGGGPLYSFSASYDGRFILLAQGDGAVGIIDRSGLSPARVIGQHDPIRRKSKYNEGFEKAHPSAVLSVGLSPDGRIAASGGLDGMIRIWGPTQQ